MLRKDVLFVHSRALGCLFRGRFANYKLLGHYFLINFWVAIDALEQKLTCTDSHEMRLIDNGLHARSDIGCMNIVGETYECYVFRDAQPAILDRGEGCKTDNIVESEDGIRTVGTSQQFLGGF